MKNKNLYLINFRSVRSRKRPRSLCCLSANNGRVKSPPLSLPHLGPLLAHETTPRRRVKQQVSRPSSPTKGKARFDIKALMRGHTQGTKRARFCLVSVPVVMILIMITRPLYAPLIDVFGEDGLDAQASGMDSSSDVNPAGTPEGGGRKGEPLSSQEQKHHSSSRHLMSLFSPAHSLACCPPSPVSFCRASK